jgi:hypothetical protein
MAALDQAIQDIDRPQLADSANSRSNFKQRSASGKSRPTAVLREWRLSGEANKPKTMLCLGVTTLSALAPEPDHCLTGAARVGVT